MKKFFSILFLLIVSVTAFAQKDLPDKPNPPRLVNDLTGNFLTPEQSAALERKLVAYDNSTSNQIAVVIVNDLKGYSAADFAIGVGKKWQVGNQNFNNGVVLLVSTGGGQGNRDVFIAPGYGLEGAIPDLTADAIIDNELIPNFKAGNYYRGLDEATDALIKAAEGRYKAPEGYGNRGLKKKAPGIGAIIFLIIMLIIIFSRRGGGGGGMVSRRGYGGFGTGWLLGSLLGGGSGWSGGGSGGGWSGGGGFGGFGGGGFGGGGAGGKW
jgi:uncharacterized protein